MRRTLILALCIVAAGCVTATTEDVRSGGPVFEFNGTKPPRESADCAAANAEALAGGTSARVATAGRGYEVIVRIHNYSTLAIYGAQPAGAGSKISIRVSPAFIPIGLGSRQSIADHLRAGC